MNIDYLVEQGFKPYRYGREELIYRAGDMPRYVYFIKSGRVKMITANAEGREFIQGIFEAGSYFGEPALIVSKAYLADTVTLEDCVIFKVTREQFFSFLHDPEFSLSLIKVLSNRLFYKSMMLEEVANENAAHSLLTLIAHLSEGQEKGQKLRVTRSQLADMSGLRVETVIRTVKELAGTGKITLAGGKIVV